MEAFLRSKVLAFDRHFLAWLGFIWFDFMDLWTFRSVTHRIAFHPVRIRSLDGFHIVERKSGPFHDRSLLARLWFRA
jgi:hypothetical protein